MIDEECFLKCIEHTACRDGNVEQSDCIAFKIDDQDGIAKALGLEALSKVDYFYREGNLVRLIEVSDLQDLPQKCNQYYERLLRLDAMDKNTLSSELPRRVIRKIKKEAWRPFVDEFIKKYCGSIAIIERLYRKQAQIEVDPEYEILIVCKDNTDIRILDEFKERLSGMMGKVKLCTTAQIQMVIEGIDRENKRQR